MKHSIPTVSDAKLKKFSHIKPVVQDGGILFYLKECSPRDESFTWSTKTKKAIHLKSIGSIKTLHTYGYYGMFKPSLAEVIAQTPNDILNKAIAFRTVGPNNADDLNKNKEELDAGFHVAETIFYIEDKKKKDLVISDSEFYKLSVEDKLDYTYCLSEEDAYIVYERYFDNYNKKWFPDGAPIVEYIQSCGAFVTVGYFGEHPVCIGISWVKINSKWFGFWEPTSRVVDHKLIDDFFSLRYYGNKSSKSSGGCLQYITEAKKTLNE